MTFRLSNILRVCPSNPMSFHKSVRSTRRPGGHVNRYVSFPIRVVVWNRFTWWGHPAHFRRVDGQNSDVAPRHPTAYNGSKRHWCVGGHPLLGGVHCTRVGSAHGKWRRLRAADSSTASRATRHQSADLATPAGAERHNHRATSRGIARFIRYLH